MPIFYFIKEEKTIKILTEKQYTNNNSVYQPLISPSSYINNYNSDLNKHKGYIQIVTITPKGKIKTIRAYTLQEYQQIEVSNNMLISPSYKPLEFNKELNYYYTRTPYKTPTSRLNSDIRGISSIVIDIDNNNKYLDSKDYIRDKEKIEKRLNQNLIDKGLLPNYTTFVFSGTGVQLVYEFEQVSPKAEMIIKMIIKSLSNTIQRYLRADKTLSMYQVDNVASNNVGGLARLGGYNTKSNLAVTRQHTGIKYTLDTILERLGVVKSDSPTQSKADTKERLEVDKRLGSTTIFLLKHRLKQIDIFKDLKEKEGLAEGYRNTALFLYANTVAPLNKEQAKDLVNQYNNTFIKPLPQAQVRGIIRQLDKNIYKFKTETFNNWLEIDDHNKHLFRTGQIPRRTETIKKMELKEVEIKELLNNENLSNKQIANKLNKTIMTINRYRVKYNIPSKYKRTY